MTAVFTEEGRVVSTHSPQMHSRAAGRARARFRRPKSRFFRRVWTNDSKAEEPTNRNRIQGYTVGEVAQQKKAKLCEKTRETNWLTSLSR